MILCFQGVWAQNLMHSKPLDYNAGFAGSKKNDRISFHFNEIGDNSKNSYFSYDRLVKPLKGGIGVYGNRKNIALSSINNNQEVKNEYLLTKVGGIYSPKIILKNKYLISPSLLVDYTKLNFQKKQKLDETNSILLNEVNEGSVGSKIGILINSKDGYFGYSFEKQFSATNYNQHSFQAGYIFNLDEKVNIILDGRFNHGLLLDNLWRNYTKQFNLAYQYGVLFIGAGLNDYKYVTGMMGVKLINLKINAAYHVLRPSNMSNVELGLQYTFDNNSDEKLQLPFKKWLLKLRM